MSIESPERSIILKSLQFDISFCTKIVEIKNVWFYYCKKEDVYKCKYKRFGIICNSYFLLKISIMYSLINGGYVWKDMKTRKSMTTSGGLSLN